MAVIEQDNSVVPLLLVIPAEGNAFTVMVPVALADPHPPVRGIL
jgi:hypothetical protein